MALISFRGPLGAGKTTAANVAVERFGFERIAFADPVKLEVYDILEEGFFRFPDDTPKDVYNAWDSDIRVNLRNPSRQDKLDFINKHKKTLRPLLQWWGTEYRRAQDPDYWLNIFRDQVVKLDGLGQSVVVDDTRFMNELMAIKRMGGYDVLVNAPEETILRNLKKRDGTTSKGIAAHASETGLDVTPDFSIYNDGDLERLQSNAAFVIQRVFSNPSPPKRRMRKGI